MVEIRNFYVRILLGTFGYFLLALCAYKKMKRSGE